MKMVLSHWTNLHLEVTTVLLLSSKEGNFDLKMNIKSSGGDKGSFTGGEGGTSTIQIAAKKNTEYVVLGISNNSAVFIYEKARLIACVGQGGSWY